MTCGRSQTRRVLIGCAVLASVASCRLVAGVDDVSFAGATASGAGASGATTTGAGGSGGLTGVTGSGGAGGAQCEDIVSDSKNCGTCGHDCQGGPCVEGLCRPMTLSDAPGAAFSLALDDANVYWTDGHVHRTPKTGAPDVVLADAVPGSFFAVGIAVDAKYAYFTNWAGANSDPLPIARVSKTVAYADYKVLSENFLGPYALAIDDTHAFWTNTWDASGVVRTALTGDEPSTVLFDAAGMKMWALAIDDTDVFYTAEGPPGLPGGLFKTPKNGTKADATQLATILSGVGGVVVDSSFVYWLDGAGGGSLHRSDKNGGGAVVLAATAWSEWAAQDERYVYWTVAGFDNPVGGSVRRFPKRGGKVQMLAEELHGAPSGIAVDATSVYWLNSQDPTNALMKLAL